MRTAQLFTKLKKPNDILQEIRKLENDIKTVSEWLSENGLVFNNDKLKYITFSSKRKINDKSYLICSHRKSIAEETTSKLLGVDVEQNLTWSSHVNSIVKASYGILRIMKTFTHSKIRKSLAESLALSRLNYSNVLIGQLPNYLQNRLQRVQECRWLCHRSTRQTQRRHKVELVATYESIE